MNHIYKTVLNKNTGLIDVVSENTSNHSRSKKVSSSQAQINEKEIPKKNIPTVKISYMCLLISLIMSTPVIASTDYDGTNSLTNSATIPGNFNKLIPTRNILGIFDQNSTKMNIDYSTGTTPNFVLTGYNFIALNDTAQTASASGNTINLKQGDINGPVYSGLVHGSTTNEQINTDTFLLDNKTLDANNNSVNILNNDKIQVSSGIFSGFSAININFDDTTHRGDINAYIRSEANILNANNNIISTTGDNNTLNDISAGYAGININLKSFMAPAPVTSANVLYNTLSANNNIISITGDNNTLNDISAGYAGININFGDITRSEASSNISVFNDVDNNTLSANNNIISITGDNNTLNDISAGYAGFNINYNDLIAPANADAYADNNTLSANNNIISITGDNNTLNDISAGYAGININFGDIIGGTTTDDLSLSIDPHDSKLYTNQNKISLTGSSTISGDLKTGTIDFIIQHGKVENANGEAGGIDIINYLTGTKSYANDNSISIEGTHQFTNPNSVIYGGSLNIGNPDYKPETYDVFTGNTLIYNNSLPINIKEIGNFQTYNFTLNPALANTNTALITAQTVNLGTNEANSSNYLTTPVASDIYVVGIQSGKLVPTDSKFILMQADAGQLTGTGHASTVNQIRQGISLDYDVETSVDYANDQVIATILNGHEPEVNPQLKALLEGNLSGLMLLTRGADHLSDNLFSAITEQNTQRGLTPFVIFSGNHSKYDTGSYIKSNGGLFTVGLSIQDDQWLAGAFIENGWDSYKTFNDFTNADEVRGKGHNRFNGVGLYGHYDFMNGWYADATIRGGRLHTAFSTDDIRNSMTGESASYDLSHNYYGMNLEGGYKLALDEKNTLDLNTKYLWATTSSKSIIIADDPIHFKKLTSQRIQFNAENNYQLNPEMIILTGLGYEYEFDGKTKGTTYGIYDIDQASVKGSTGIATVGLRYEPKAYDRFSIDLKGSGYFGKREGGAAMLKMDYKF